ncbi:MAG: hypothetical protein MJ025_01515 [Victivallaceae bacterium]|nr:hypothetical protein [Victivallaceae bacterium]
MKIKSLMVVLVAIFASLLVGCGKESKEFTKLKADANRGDAVAQCKLGDMYANGNMVKQDLGEAVRWYEKSAAQGNGDAQCRMGDYCYGKKSYAQAYHWYLLASEKNDNQDAAVKVKEFAQIFRTK